MLGACSASGKFYKESTQLNLTVDPEKAKITIFRPNEFVAGGRSAFITVNSKESKFIENGGFVLFDVTPQEHLIDVRLKDDKRYCEFRVNLAAGENRFFEIKPNSETIIANAISNGIAAGFNYAGEYASGNAAASMSESSFNPKKCNGIFYIFSVEQNYALKKLESIRESTQ